MSDLSPDERTPSPPVARRRRPKYKASTPHRANRPAITPTNTQSAAEPLASPEKKAATSYIVPIARQKAADQPQPEEVAAPGDRFTYRVRNWTILSKPIIIWAIIVGVGSMIVAVGPGLMLTVLGVTQKQLDNNPDLEGTLGWGTFILSFGLPVVGGWRATIREGSWKQGGMTSFWGALIFTVLLLIYYVVYAAFTGNLSQLDGSFFGGLLESFIVQGLLGFGLGAIGGSISAWQRLRAQRAQELLTSSS